MSEQAQAAGQDNTAPQAQGNDQATSSTLLTGAASAPPADKTEGQLPDASQQQQGTEGQATDETKPEGEDKTDDQAEGAPEKYELQAPEGFEKLDEQLVETFEPLARELNLSNEKANKLVETMMPKVVERLAEQQREAWGQQLEQWADTVKSDKELGGEALPANLQAAKRAMDRFATPEFRSLIEHPSVDPKGLGLGNHPELVRVFARIGKAMEEDGFISGNGSTGDGGGGLYSHLPKS